MYKGTDLKSVPRVLAAWQNSKQKKPPAMMPGAFLWLLFYKGLD